MRARCRRSTALVLGLTLGLPPLAAAPASEAGTEGAGVEAAGVAGAWEGWATLTNDWPGSSCRYEGGRDEVSVRLELSPEAGGLRGSAAVDLPAAPGSTCPPLRKRYSIDEVTEGPGTVAFTDSEGNEWTLSVRRNGTVLQGLLAWRAGGAEHLLAEGFTLPDGTRPTARLSGEVRLHRPGSAEEKGASAKSGPAAAAAPAASASKGGSAMGHVGAILGANVVGLGLLYGVNKLGHGTSTEGVVTCSPRVCIVGAPGAPCFCEGNVVSGAECGTTTGGAPLNAPCDGKGVPCEAALSCNSGICEDRYGRCPY
jgi:hypothetical protein